jgi:hypothetical protein
MIQQQGVRLVIKLLRYKLSSLFIWLGVELVPDEHVKLIIMKHLNVAAEEFDP